MFVCIGTYSHKHNVLLGRYVNYEYILHTNYEIDDEVSQAPRVYKIYILNIHYYLM